MQSSPVLQTIVKSAGFITAARPSTSFAPPVPPVRTTIIGANRKPMVCWNDGVLVNSPVVRRSYQAVGAAKSLDMRDERGRKIFVPLMNEFRIDRQARPELEACLCALFLEQLQRRPGRLRIDEVWRQWRHATPVVDSGLQVKLVTVRRQIRRRLDVHVAAENQP